MEITDKKLNLIINKPHILGHIAGKTLLTGLHSKWIKYIWDASENRSLQGHRGSYKTTAITIIGTIWWLLFHPNDRIAIVRKKFSDSSECVTVISQIMRLPEIQIIFQFAHGFRPKAIIDRADKITFNFKKSKTPEGNIDAYGVDTDITGKHYDKIICDDFVTLKDRVSKAEREKTKSVIREIQTNIVDPGKQVCFIGTPWEKNDAWSIVPEPIKYSVYKTDILTKDIQQEKRRLTTPSLYAANYELKHIASEDSLFKEVNFKRWDFKIKSGVYSHIDAKYGGDCTNALTFMARKPDRRIQAIGFTSNKNVKLWYKFIKNKWKKYFCGSLFTEDNADKGFLCDALRKEGVSAKTYNESTNKHIKIVNYLYSTWDIIDWDPDTDPEYLNQILDYQEGQKPDDCVDGPASLIREKFFKKNKSNLYDE